jgi:hypothetical protein
MKKVQIPVMGGLRKVIQVTNPVAALANPGTTITEFANQTINLAQLKAALGIQPIKPSAGGNAAPASLVPGPGLSGGGVMVGAVPINLTAPIPAFVFDEGGGGGDGDPGPPGVAGKDGPTGAQGPMGPAAYLAAEDGEDGWHAIPGRDGAAGTTGAQGPVGPAAYMAGEDGEDGWHAIPGRDGAPGVAGATGAQGPIGPALMFLAEDGADGDPGPPGAAGAGVASATPVPATLKDLVLWYKTDPLNVSVGNSVPFLANSTPWYLGVSNSQAANTGGVISAAQLNLLNTLTLAGGEHYTSPTGVILHTSTVFAVVKPTNLSGGSAVGVDITSGGTNSLEVRLDTAGKFLLVQAGTATIGGSTSAAVTVGAWSQINCTYDDTSGSYSFRSGRVNIGSGVNVKTLTAANTGILWFVPASFNLDFIGSVAEIIIYNRVLSAGEITSVENYLFGKWAV